MATLYHAFKSGVVDNNPLTNSGTTLNSTGLANLPTVTAPDVLWLSLDPDGTAGTPELVKVTAHTASATTATIVREQQTANGGGAARQHAQNTVWMHVATPADMLELPSAKMTATGDLLYASAANTAARLAVGTAGQVLEVSGGVPAWGQVDTAGIADDAVNQAKIAANAVGTAEIIDANVTTAKIADLNVTAGKVANDALTDTQMSSNNKTNQAWTTLTLLNSYTGSVKYTRIGKTGFIRGALSNGTGSPGSGVPVGTLAAGYRPAASFSTTAHRGAQDTPTAINFLTDGTVYLTAVLAAQTWYFDAVFEIA